MLIIDKNGTQKVLRNLEEQVLENKQRIAEHYAIDRAMANLGIKVVGQVTLSTDLPDPETYTGEYGDTYAVGNKNYVDEGYSTYDYYVFSRPDPDSGHNTEYWLNVGKISIEGPQGPRGPQGIKGDTGNSTKWYLARNGIDNLSTTGFVTGDMCLDITNGNTYRYDENIGWALAMNIMGPQGEQGLRGIPGARGEQGPQGVQGEPGPVGPLVEILGELNNIGLLPAPSTVQRNAGYIVDNHVYIIVGEENDLDWYDAGSIGIDTANLVTFDDYATENKAGVIKVAANNTNAELYIDAQGNLKLGAATESEIIARTQNKAVVCTNYDIAVRQALTNPPTTFNSAERTNICSNIGAMRTISPQTGKQLVPLVTVSGVTSAAVNSTPTEQNIPRYDNNAMLHVAADQSQYRDVNTLAVSMKELNDRLASGGGGGGVKFYQHVLNCTITERDTGTTLGEATFQVVLPLANKITEFAQIAEAGFGNTIMGFQFTPVNSAPYLFLTATSDHLYPGDNIISLYYDGNYIKYLGVSSFTYFMDPTPMNYD